MSKKRIAVSGSHGLIGSILADFLGRQGYDILPIVHGEPSSSSDRIYLDHTKGVLNASLLEGLEAVIHLAGANIAGRRWTADYKKEIWNSRVKGTQLLAEALAKLKNPPKVFFSASAVGIYGNRAAGEEISENSKKGQGFLSDLCDAWETSTWPATRNGIRVIHPRFGMVLSEKGGALAKMLPIFRLGLGGKIGSGEQMISWVALNEIPYVILHIMEDISISGAVNVVSPNPVSNQEFTAALGEVLTRPTVLPLPSVGAKIMFGEMADDLLLSGARVVPTRLRASQYKFSFPLLRTTLSQILKK